MMSPPDFFEDIMPQPANPVKMGLNYRLRLFSKSFNPGLLRRATGGWQFGVCHPYPD
jgi:hypothetical protein